MANSRSASSTSLDTQPPLSEVRLLSVTMDNAFQSNHRALEDPEREDELEPSEQEEEPLQMKPPEGPKLSQMATVYPPKPCERCVRMNRTCKGIAGSRCEYCKRLKQKCSNATGPARGRHATRLAMLAAAAAQGINPPPQAVPVTSASTWTVRPKRKPASGKGQGTSPSAEEDDYEDDGHEPPAKLNKKRRSSKQMTPTQTKLLERITELQNTVRQLQSNTAKEVDRIHQTIEQLMTDVREMDSID